MRETSIDGEVFMQQMQQNRESDPQVEMPNIF